MQTQSVDSGMQQAVLGSDASHMRELIVAFRIFASITHARWFALFGASASTIAILVSRSRTLAYM